MLNNTRIYWLAGCYALTIFVSAFLLFQVQPVISKTILPWFGGAPAVWTTCMLFFQVLLFLGYAYAHLLTRCARPTQQGIIHFCLIVTALLLLPITPGPEWKPADSSQPTFRILLLLAVNVGAPYFLLSSTGPLVQAWFARSYVGRSPYRLYALSNVGSLLALLSYPFLVEPALTTRSQGALWSVGFCLFALVCGYLAVRLWQSAKDLVGAVANDPLAVDGRQAKSTTENSESSNLSVTGDKRPVTCESNSVPAGVPQRPGWSHYAGWLLLPAFASMMLLATTNHVCQDVAVVPFLWVLPLSLYLVSFIICFDNERWYHRFWFAAAALAVIVAISLTGVVNEGVPIVLETVLYFAALFLICMLCHGELVRRKPSVRYLTAFYLMCSAGGALGGVLVAVVCPAIFNGYWETPIGVIFAYALAAFVFFPEFRQRFGKGDLQVELPNEQGDTDKRFSPVFASPGAEGRGAPHSSWTVVAPLTLFLGLLTVVSLQLRTVHAGAEVSIRNFYGVLHVRQRAQAGDRPPARVMIHGRIVHGLQLDGPEKRRIPTAYYNPSSGVGLVMQRFRGDQPLRVGVVGLGVGTLAAYGRPGDYHRYYEINPDVIRLAREHFTFLDDTPARVDLVLGDARLSLEREAGQQFDILVLDAFSGDSIPVHLLTREAFAVYERHLKPDGVLTVNVSNRHLDLAPVLAGQARHHNYEWLYVRSETNLQAGATAAEWMILTRNARLLEDNVIRDAAIDRDEQYAAVPVWTDDYNNLLMVLR